MYMFTFYAKDQLLSKKQQHNIQLEFQLAHILIFRRF